MSNNGSAYISKVFAKACRTLGLRHIRTRPYTPSDVTPFAGPGAMRVGGHAAAA